MKGEWTRSCHGREGRSERSFASVRSRGDDVSSEPEPESVGVKENKNKVDSRKTTFKVQKHGPSVDRRFSKLEDGVPC